MVNSFADPDDFGDMLSLSDVAKLLGVHLGTARRYARDGVIPTHRLPGGRRYYILKDELLDFIRAQPSEPADDADPVGLQQRDHGQNDAV